MPTLQMRQIKRMSLIKSEREFDSNDFLTVLTRIQLHTLHAVVGQRCNDAGYWLII